MPLLIDKPTMTEMWHQACEHLLFAEREELDAWSGVQGNIYNCFLTAESMAFDFDIGRDIWLTKTRFPKLQRDYLDPDGVKAFLHRCVHLTNGSGTRRGMITSLPTKHAAFNDGSAHHAWGNCMMGFSYHGGGKGKTPPTFALYSRATYMAYLGPLDLGVTWMLAREVARRTNREVEEFRFVWYLGSAAWHTMKCIPYIINHGLLDEVLDTETYPDRKFPCCQKMRWTLKQFEANRLAGNLAIAYGPLRRMQQRYQKVMNGTPMPSIPIGSLELLPEYLEG